MLFKENEKKKFSYTIIIMLAAGLLLGIFWYQYYGGAGTDGGTENIQEAEPPAKEDRKETVVISKKIEMNNKKMTPSEEGTVSGDIIVLPTIDYKELENNKKLKELMILRKTNLGIKKSLDMIVRSDETFTIGGRHISMRDILEKSFLKNEAVFEEQIEESGAVTPKKIKEYGIYVVQPGDNIWNIHFNILRDYYEHQGISVSSKADEPGNSGKSSGVGKILKFSEIMVIIYNLVSEKVDTKVDLLEPLSKIVVYNMEEVFSLLQEIDFKIMERVQFDGKTIWIPTEKI